MTTLFPFFQRQGRSRKAFKAGFIDKTGAVKIPPEFDDCMPFSEGLAAVAVAGRWGYINDSGEMVIAPTFLWGGAFHEGLAAIRYPIGFINPKGQMVIAARFAHAGDFSAGVAWVRPTSDDKAVFFIDRHGATVSDVYEDARDYSEGLAAVRSSGVWGYVDTSGQYAIRPMFRDPVAGRFVDGHARVSIDGKWGLINKAGEIVVAPQFDMMYDPSSGRVTVWRGDRGGFIDMSGKVVIPCKYRFVRPFSEGLTPARREYRSGVGYIDMDGRGVIPAKFEKGLDFDGGLAWVETDKTVGYCDTEGKMVWEGPWVETRM